MPVHTKSLIAIVVAAHGQAVGNLDTVIVNAHYYYKALTDLCPQAQRTWAQISFRQYLGQVAQ